MQNQQPPRRRRPMTPEERAMAAERRRQKEILRRRAMRRYYAFLALLGALAQRPCCGTYFAAILKMMESNIPLQTAWEKVFSTISDAETAAILRGMEVTGDETRLLTGLQYAQQRLRQLAERRELEDIRDRRLTGAALLSAAGLLVILLI